MEGRVHCPGFRQFVLNHLLPPTISIMRTVFELFLIGLGGAMGAISRYAIHETAIRLTANAFPFGTLVANLLGCFLVGMLMGSGRTEENDSLRLGFGVGFLGALTTFSTFGGETVARVNEGQWMLALVNVLANVLLGLTCVFIGYVAGKRLFT